MFLKGYFWDLIDKFFNQGVNFVITILLARILSPEDFGLVGIILAIIAFSQVFSDLGFSIAIIQKQDLSETECSTIFYLNLVLGGVLTGIMYVSSGPVAVFFDRPSLEELIKWTSCHFLINSFSLVQTALFLKQLSVKPLAIIKGIAVIVSGACGLFMAYNGFGVYSLIAQSVLNVFINSLLLWIQSPWKPGRIFDLSSIKDLWQYGSKLFVAGLLENAFSKFDVLIIGKFFSPASLGFYTRAQSLNSLIIQVSSGSLVRVFLPTLSRHQNDTEKVVQIYRDALIFVSFAALGILSVLYITADDIIILLFSDKWAPAILYFKLLLLSGYGYPLSAIMVNVILARGKSSDFLKLDMIKKIVLAAALIIGFQVSIVAFIYCLAIASLISVFLNMFFVSKELGFSVLAQVKLVGPYFIIALLAIFSGLLVGKLFDARILNLICNGALVFMTYILLNYILRTKAFNFFMNKARFIMKV